MFNFRITQRQEDDRAVDVITNLHFHIRGERSSDRHAVRKVNEASFERSDEADLVGRLWKEGAVLLSLVAELEGQIVGHILFNRMWIETAHGALPAVSLAPMAVSPDYQRRGIGSELVRHGLAELRNLQERIAIVLGHKDYYPRFGFTSEKARNLSSPFPPEAYLALELVEGALADVRGTVRYPAAFGL
jgi:putative acetyltransferase